MAANVGLSNTVSNVQKIETNSNSDTTYSFKKPISILANK